MIRACLPHALRCPGPPQAPSGAPLPEDPSLCARSLTVFNRMPLALELPVSRDYEQEVRELGAWGTECGASCMLREWRAPGWYRCPTVRTRAATGRPLPPRMQAAPEFAKFVLRRDLQLAVGDDSRRLARRSKGQGSGLAGHLRTFPQPTA